MNLEFVDCDATRLFHGIFELCVEFDSDVLTQSVVGFVSFRYGASAKANDFDMYAPNASFEDPLTHAQGYVAPPTNNFIFIDNESLFTLVYFLSL